jgi:hypothetical protein
MIHGQQNIKSKKKSTNLFETSKVTFKSPVVWDMAPCTLAESTEALKKPDFWDSQDSRVNREEESDEDMERIDIEHGT